MKEEAEGEGWKERDMEKGQNERGWRWESRRIGKQDRMKQSRGD